MCLGVPGKVVEIEGKNCTIDVMGVTRKISIELLEGVNVGDYVIVHAGVAIQKIDEEEALVTLKLFEELKELAGD